MEEDCGGEEFEAAAFFRLDGFGIVPDAEDVGVVVGAVGGLRKMRDEAGGEGFVRKEVGWMHGVDSFSSLEKLEPEAETGHCLLHHLST